MARCVFNEALTAQFCDLIKPFCDSRGIVYWSRAQYEAAPLNPYLVALYGKANGSIADTADVKLTKIAQDLEKFGLRAETTAIFCEILVKEEAVEGDLILSHYTAQLFQFE